jgi:DNA-directed RNA polymerase I and III subunit RPAC1
MSEEEKRNFSYKVMSESIEWHPAGNQENVYPEGVKPVDKDIVITVLRPGQQLEFEAHAVKGIGKDHTKFSPVATASYRLMPDISFSEKVINERAYELRDTCPMGVFDIEDIKLPDTAGKVPIAVAARPRDCTMCRECIRKDGWSESVILRRKADHFIFSVESTGCIPAADVVEEAISILKAKANKFYHLADEYVEA